MTKGKKQQTVLESLVSAPASTVIPLGDEYSSIGLELQKTSSGLQGAPFVLVNPHVGERRSIKISRTPLGALAPTLLNVMGIEDQVVDAILANARPLCGQCKVLAERSERIEPSELPRDGYVALVVEGGEQKISLAEQCELLGAERALVEGLLVRAEDVGRASGEPVLNLISATLDREISREIDVWFSRGGGTLRIVHFESRGCVGREVKKVFRQWRCPGCGSSFAKATRDFVADADLCQRCRGEGWLPVEGGRLVACEDCDGFAYRSAVGDYEFAGLKLRHLAGGSLERILEHLSTLPHALSAGDQLNLLTMCQRGFGDYPLGMPKDLLSKGEKTLATVVSASLSRLSHVTLVLDQGTYGFESEALARAIREVEFPRVAIIAPRSIEELQECEKSNGKEQVRLHDVNIGPLRLGSFSFDVGDLVLIQGDVGTGKSLLLDEIQRRFAKRRKLSHLASFGTLKKIVFCRHPEMAGGVVGDLLGLGAEIASEAGQVRDAQARGLTKEDFLYESSHHRCHGCIEHDGKVQRDCAVCGGRLFDPHVAGVRVCGVQFGDLMRATLKEVSKALWSNDRIASLIDQLPESLSSVLRLGTFVSDCDPAVLRFLSVFAPLCNLRASRREIKGTLVLIDNPFGIAPSYQSLMLHCIKELRRDGATVVCAGAPKGLENIFGSVVRLRAVGYRSDEGALSKFFDTRISRRVELCDER